MKLLKRASMLALALVLLGCFASCKGEDKPAPETKGEEISLTNENGEVRYEVIRPDSCSEDVKNAAVLLKKQLEAITGKDVGIGTDFVERGIDESEYAAKFEILVGDTCRAESQEAISSLEDNRYVIRHSGNKIVIAGKDDLCTVYATEQFLSAFSKNDDGTYRAASVIPEAAFREGSYSPLDGPIFGKYYVRNLEGYYKTQGRTFLTENGLELLYTCCSFEFNANCQGKVSVTMYSENTGTGDWAVFFTGYVDGERCETRFAVNGDGETELVLAEDLPAGDHTFALVRQTEWDRGDTYAKAIALDGVLTEKPKDQDLYIEFIGDSLTSAFGNLSDIQAEGWGGMPLFQDGTQSFGYLTAQALHADCSIVAIQGIGVVCGPQEIVMGDVYPKFPFVSDPSFTYSFDRKADIVVINMGTNDFETMAAKGHTTAEVMDAMKALALMVREKNPGCKIVFVTGMQPSFTRELKKLAKDLGAEANGYYYLKLKQEMSGHEGHTSVKGHEENAEILTEYLRKLIG